MGSNLIFRRSFADGLIADTNPDWIEATEHEITLMWLRPIKLSRLAEDCDLDREMFFKSHDRSRWVLSIPREIADWIDE